MFVIILMSFLKNLNWPLTYTDLINNDYMLRSELYLNIESRKSFDKNLCKLCPFMRNKERMS